MKLTGTYLQGMSTQAGKVEHITEIDNTEGSPTLLRSFSTKKICMEFCIIMNIQRSKLGMPIYSLTKVPWMEKLKSWLAPQSQEALGKFLTFSVFTFLVIALQFCGFFNPQP